MGGKGSGGRRLNSGPARRIGSVRWQREQKRVRKGGGKPSGAPTAVREPLEAPPGMSADQRAVWVSLAPHAIAAGTLTAATVVAFLQLCSRIVLLRAMEAQIEADGIMADKVTLQMDEKGGGLQSVEKKAHDLLTKYMTLMQRVDQAMLRFRLAPMGKELVPPEPPVDEWQEFDQKPLSLVQR